MTITALPPAPLPTDTQTQFNTKAFALVAALDDFVTETNATAVAVDADAAAAAASAVDAAEQAGLATTNGAEQVALAAIQVGLAEDQAVAAAASASAASATAGATKWVSGTTYAQGVNVWSPIDFQTYRREIAGAGTTDPSLDSANWEKITGVSGGISSSATTTGSANITLTVASAGYQSVAMTAMGKHVTLPDATTMSVGGPRFIIKNDGGYPFGIRDASGVLLMGVAAGGTAYIALKGISTAAGEWSVIGDNLEPGLITIDNTFSSTYSSTVQKPFVALDGNKSIHFLALTTGFAAVAVDNTTGAVGTPVTVTTSPGNTPRAAFKVSATSAIVFADDGGGNGFAVVVSLTGPTTLSIGTAATGGNYSAEDFSGAPKIAQLSSTLYLASYTSGTNTSVVAISVSGTTVTIGTAANIITANSVSDSTTTYALTATTALVLYKSGASAPYANNGVVISVSGTTCTVGTPAALTGVASSVTGEPISCQLSPTKVLVCDGTNGNVNAAALTVSGTSISVGAALTIEASTGVDQYYTVSAATRHNSHLFPLSSSTALLWYFTSGKLSRTVVLSESGGTVTKGDMAYEFITSAAANAGDSGKILPQGTNEVCVYNQLVTTGGSVISTAKISGSTISIGGSEPIRSDFVTSGVFNASRLSSGKYVSTPPNASSGYGLSVWKSNGDYIENLGLIKGVYSGGGASGLFNFGVSPNRLVIPCVVSHGRVGTTSTRPRLLSVEIAK